MDIIEALQFKYWLDKHIQKCLSLNISYEEIFESIFDDHDIFNQTSQFLRTEIGRIWLGRVNGQNYTKWQEEGLDASEEASSQLSN